MEENDCAQPSLVGAPNVTHESSSSSTADVSTVTIECGLDPDLTRQATSSRPEGIWVWTHCPPYHPTGYPTYSTALHFCTSYVWFSGPSGVGPDGFPLPVVHDDSIPLGPRQRTSGRDVKTGCTINGVPPHNRPKATDIP